MRILVAQICFDIKQLKRISAGAVLLVVLTRSGESQNSDKWAELNIRLSPSITAAQLVQIAKVTEPVTYTTRSGESLAEISSKRYGIKGRMRDAVRLVNPELVKVMGRQGKDFFWQPLPPETVVQLPALSRFIKDAVIRAADEQDVVRKARPFYWSIGPKTLRAIHIRNASQSPKESEVDPARETRKAANITLPAVPTFQSLRIRAGKSVEAQNVLQSLTTLGVASGQIAAPTFLEKVVSPCESAEEVTDDWFVRNAHANEIPIDRLNLSQTIIAVLDSGVDVEHGALKEHFWDGSISENEDLDLRLEHTFGINFTASPVSNDVHDLTPNSHGTHVAGIASGAAILKALPSLQGKDSVTAIKIMLLKVVDNEEHVNIQAIEDALQFAQRFQAKIVSASWNVNRDINLQTQMLNEQGTLFVLAAGNGVKEGDSRHGLNLEDNDIYPPSFRLDNAITVGALAANGNPTEFSNYGSKTVQIFAPGCAITSTVNGNAYARETGTSQAAPFVSVTAALIWAQNPSLSPLAIKRRILQTADPVKESISKSSVGNLNVAKATSIKEDLVETTDGAYAYGEVLDDSIVIAAPGDSCEETNPLKIRRQKVTRIYHGYGQLGNDIAIQQNGTRTEGKVCSTSIRFKHESGMIEEIPIEHITDVVLKM